MDFDRDLKEFVIVSLLRNYEKTMKTITKEQLTEYRVNGVMSENIKICNEIVNLLKNNIEMIKSLKK